MSIKQLNVGMLMISFLFLLESCPVSDVLSQCQGNLP
jgi:hypothetical protein